MGYAAHDLYGISRDERSWSFDTEKDKAPALVRFTDKPQSGVGNGRPNSHLRVADLTNNWCPATKAMTHYRSSSSVGVEAWNGCPNVITSRNLCLVIRRPRCNPGRIAPEWFLHPGVKNHNGVLEVQNRCFLVKATCFPARSACFLVRTACKFS